MRVEDAVIIGGMLSALGGIVCSILILLSLSERPAAECMFLPVGKVIVPFCEEKSDAPQR